MDNIYFDFSTTGKSNIYDEISEMSIIDDEENILFSMSFNEEKPFASYAEEVNSIINKAEKYIVTYDCNFNFLYKYNISNHKVRVYDLYVYDFYRFKYSLDDVAYAYGYKIDKHTTLDNVRAIKFLYEKISKENRRANEIRKRIKKSESIK